MKRELNLVLLGLVLLLSSESRASNAIRCAGEPHTLHQISVNQNATCVLSKLYEPNVFCLVDGQGDDLSDIPFDVDQGAPFRFAMKFNPGADFNMEFALTCVAKDGNNARSPKVIFAVGADGAATPHIETVNLYGAKGSWISNHRGEDFTVVF